MLVAILTVLGATGDAPQLSLEDQGPRYEEFGGAPHFHGEISLLGAGSVATAPAAGVGFGLHLEAGIVLEGVHLISARLSGATLGLFTSFQGGVSFAERFADRFTLGVGVTWGGMIALEPRISWLSFQAPLRFTMQLGEGRRRGFIFGAELALGVAHNAGSMRVRPEVPTASVMGQLTIGYAVW